MDNNNFPAQDLKNLTGLKEINIADTNIDGGLEYLPDEFFNVNAVASGLNLERGHFLRKLFCTGNLAKQLNDYKIEAREEIEVNELNEESIKFLEWESIFKEIKELYEQLRCYTYLKLISE
ncbi:unnamed protein product [Rhizophagus irregularis]|nr:unnamed protein product [Rhizophagus irregularis]